jgi:phenylacetic acid degradation operon negative regulatory protein
LHTDPQAAFVIRSLLIHEYRRLHLRDPMLPEQLLPPEWPGTRAAHLCREIYRRIFKPSEGFLSSVAARLDGALPPPDQAIEHRFGGLKIAPEPAEVIEAQRRAASTARHRSPES